MGHGIVKLYCFNVSIERCRGTLFCARCPGTHQLGISIKVFVGEAWRGHGSIASDSILKSRSYERLEKKDKG